MSCHGCRTPLLAGQRYCLACGEPVPMAARGWRELLASELAAGQLPAREAVPERPVVTPASLPSPRTAALLVLSMLGFGVVLGGVAGAGTAVADAPGVIVVQGAAPAPATALPAEPATPATGDGLDPALGALPAVPAAAAEPAPEPAPPEQSPAAEPAPADDPAGDEPATTATLPPVKHVWVIALHGSQPADVAGAPYLGGTLPAQGLTFGGYAPANADPAGFGVALLGGRAPGAGAFPAAVPALPGRLTAVGQSWKVYVDGLAAAPGENPCADDPTTQPANPVLWFASVATTSECASQVAPGTQLATDLADPDAVAALSYLVPPADPAQADGWAQGVVEKIRGSKAYKDGGLIVIAADGSAAQPVPAPGTATEPVAPAPAPVAAPRLLLLSPFVTPGATLGEAVTPFTLTRTIEELFGLEPLATPATKAAAPLDRSAFGAWTPTGGG